MRQYLYGSQLGLKIIMIGSGREALCMIPIYIIFVNEKLVAFFPYIPYFFPTTIHIIAISSKISMVYVINGDIKELAMIGAVASRGTQTGIFNFSKTSLLELLVNNSNTHYQICLSQIL